MKRVKIILLLSISLLLSINSLYAENFRKMNKKPKIRNDRWYLSGGIGATWYARSKDYNVATPFPFAGTDNYHYKKDTNANVIFMLEGGYQLQRGTKWLPNYSIGLRYSYYNNNKRKGTYNLSDNRFSYPFSYKIQAQSLLALAKLSIIEWHNLSPFIIAGAGIARNNFSFYQEPSSVQLPNHAFSNNVSINFTYLFGLGVSYQLNERWQLSLEYHYADLGKAKSGKNGYNTTIPISLVEQSAMLTLRYYFA